MTVYVAHEPRPSHLGPMDLSALDPFGDVKFILARTFSPGANPTGAMQLAREALADFDFNTDYFTLAGGDPLAGVICSGVLFDMAADVDAVAFNYLRYERARNGSEAFYFPMRVTF